MKEKYRRYIYTISIRVLFFAFFVQKPKANIQRDSNVKMEMKMTKKFERKTRNRILFNSL